GVGARAARRGTAARLLRGLGETAAVSQGRAAPASVAAPIVQLSGLSLRPCFATTIAPLQRAPFRQTPLTGSERRRRCTISALCQADARELLVHRGPPPGRGFSSSVVCLCGCARVRSGSGAVRVRRLVDPPGYTRRMASRN